jgi:hypothetical protein
MKRLLSLIVCVLVLVTAGQVRAKEDSLFPDPDEISNEKPSLDTAIAQFEGIIENSAEGDLRSLKTDDKYNNLRARELQQQIAAKKEHLKAIPEIVSREFETLMKQYADADQQTKNKMADDLHARWKAKELAIQREIRELEEQLAVTKGRISKSTIKRQMLEISSSLAQSELARGQAEQVKADDPTAESPAFKALRDISSRRILSTIRGICPIQVQPLDTELSVDYLDN